MEVIEGQAIEDGGGASLVPTTTGPQAQYPAPHRSSQLMQYRREMVVTPEDAKAELERLRDFQRGVMRDGIDFAVIPGTDKPSLLKPGAETLLGAFGYGFTVQRTEMFRVDRYTDADTKPIQTTAGVSMAYKCTVTKTLPNGQIVIVAECEAFAGSDEKKWRDAPPNTIAKMSQKRAMVGAALNACAASELFTQDAEDMDPGEMGSTAPMARSGGGAQSAGGATPKWATWKFPLGKFKTKTLREVWDSDTGDGKNRGYLDWWLRKESSDPKYAARDEEQKQMIRDFIEAMRLEAMEAAAAAEPSQFPTSEPDDDPDGLGAAMDAQDAALAAQAAEAAQREADPEGDLPEPAPADDHDLAPEPAPAALPADAGISDDARAQLVAVMVKFGYADNDAAAQVKIGEQVAKYGPEQINTVWALKQATKIRVKHGEGDTF